MREKKRTWGLSSTQWYFNIQGLFEYVEAEGGRLVKEADFEAEKKI
jgi:hypothetical protein